MKPSLPLYELSLDPKALSTGFRIFSEEEILDALADGRCFSKWAESMARKLYDLHAYPENYQSDAYKNLSTGRQYSFEVKTLTKHGVNWHQSKDKGVGRQCTEKGFLHALSLHDYYIVVDQTELPVVRFIPVETSLIHYCYNKRCISWRSLSKQGFYVNFVDWGNKKFDKPSLKRSA